CLLLVVYWDHLKIIYSYLCYQSYLHSSSITLCYFIIFFSFIDPSITEIYTLSLHDALPILSAPFKSACPGLGLLTTRLIALSSSIGSSPILSTQCLKSSLCTTREMGDPNV